MGKLYDKGTQLYAIAASISPSVMVVPCITSIDGLSGPRQNIDETCFDSLENENAAGRAQPGQVTIGTIFDTNDPTFPELVALKDSGEKIWWYIGGSDGTDPPTLSSDGGVDAPTTRTGISFQGYVADIAWQIAMNNNWRDTLTIQRSGPWVLHRKQ
jgi:hypothetical protein